MGADAARSVVFPGHEVFRVKQPPARHSTWPLLLGAGLLVMGGAALAAMPVPPLRFSAAPPPVSHQLQAPADVWVEPVTPESLLCSGPDVTTAIEQLSRGLAAQRILYSSEPLSDCSGMVHRVLGGLGEQCAGLDLPEVDDARSAAELATWFSDEGRLVALPQLDDVDRWLVPGTLAFFGRPGRQGLGRVDHVGVVVEVERDIDGQVQRYAMFHGRQPGKVAGITRWHTRDASPALGNGNDALLGIAFPTPEVALAAPAMGGEPSDSVIVDAWDSVDDEEAPEQLTDGLQ